MKPSRFVIFDRDGTLIRECHYLSDPERVELLEGTIDGLRLLREMGLGLVVVTNQSAIGRGYFDESRLQEIHQRLEELLAWAGVGFDDIYFCPHTPMDECDCRKPRTGLLERAAAEHGFNPRDAFVIGDKPCDIELGQRVGATTFLVRTGYGERVSAENEATPDYVADNVWEAALTIRKIVESEKRSASNAARR